MQALGYGLRYPSILKQSLRDAICFLYQEGILKRGGIKQSSATEFVNPDQPITLQNFELREGNVSHFELMVISLLIAHYKPKNLLEIGTFDGNTTLQMGLNASADAVIHTIDLPEGASTTHLPILDDDLKFVKDRRKQSRKYLNTSVAHKIVQHLGDSTAYDFKKFTPSGPVDFCFIDGGHSYECVKSDSEQALKIIAPKGIILWHDFNPNCPGVYNYLCELAKIHPLVHITNTQLVVKF